MAQQQMQLERDERSIGDLFTQLAAETGTLVRQEVALAQSEFTVSNATYTGPVAKPAEARLVWADEFDGTALDGTRYTEW